mgnify:CR=1 FL=1
MSTVVDSKHQELSNQEIIQIAAQETGSQYSPEQVTASIMAETHEAGAIMMREGTTPLVQRADYTAPAYWIKTVDLTFDLDPARALSRVRFLRDLRAIRAQA